MGLRAARRRLKRQSLAALDTLCGWRFGRRPALGEHGVHEAYSLEQLRANQRCDLVRQILMPRVVRVHSIRADQVGPADEPVVADRIDERCSCGPGPSVEDVANLQDRVGYIGGWGSGAAPPGTT